MYQLTYAKPIQTLSSIALGLILWFVIPIPKEVTPEAWHLFAIFVGTIFAIIVKAMPIGAIAIVGIALVAITGVTSPGNPEKAISDALSGFSNSLIWLIGIAILISRGLSKTGLGARIGYYFISIFGKKTIGIAYGLTVAELVIAPVTPSNTARGGAIIHPIMRSISDSFDSKPNDESTNKMGKYLALVNHNINPITSAMFVTATAPNPLILGILNENLATKITWTSWALLAFVPGIVALLLMPLVIYFLYPPQIKSTPNATTFAKNELKKLGKITLPEIIMLFVFALLLCLWAGIPEALFGQSFKVNPTTTAFIGLSILLITGVLSWDDILKEKSAWDTITWFSSLVMMATFLNKLGFITWFSNVMEIQIKSIGLGWESTMILLVLVYFYSHYFFASATAHVTAMFAAFLVTGIALGAPPVLFGLMLGFSSGLMMSLTHYATGTSAIVFGSGYTNLGEWWKTGFVVSVVNLLVFFLIGGIWWKILGYW